jgi:hypothetical protein
VLFFVRKSFEGDAGSVCFPFFFFFFFWHSNISVGGRYLINIILIM